MSSNYVVVGTQTINFPMNYNYTPVNMETHERTLDGSMITNYTVTTGDVRVMKHIWDISGIDEFPSTFLGATGTACTVYCLGVTYSAKIMSQDYQLVKPISTGENLIRYSLSLEQI